MPSRRAARTLHPAEIAGSKEPLRQSALARMGACFPAPTRRAFSTVASAGIFPVSKIYPRTAPDEEFPSHYEFAEGHLLTRKRSCGFTATIGQATPIATTSAMRPLSVKTFRACPRR
jgi:hypothetical protein